ncbi:GNAT family N-acetyltransferase [Amorphus sp. 3PC139-8]|uniref:GNAT family N-acetyltransferase n=1 Tax=Amorphus sp. 3PC139-8 TaxID=2735676 RepID=UPI00345C7057
MHRPAKLRPAKNSDGPGLVRLISTIFADYANCHYVASEFPELAAPASHYRARGGALWVAEADGDVIGSLAIAATAEPGVFELFKVYLARPARRQGLARRLLENAISLALTGGGRRLRLWTDTRFLEGHRFYERTGFRRLPVVRAVPDASDTWEFAYVRDLARPGGST